jgi:hypothetical protein
MPRKYDKGDKRFKHEGRAPHPEVRFFKDQPKRHLGPASTAAWQLEHGVMRVTPFHRESLAQLLDQIVPQRWYTHLES